MHNYILLLAVAQAGLADLSGSWICSGKAEASPLMPAHAVRATLVVAPGPSWTKVRMTELKTAGNPLPQASLERWGAEGAGWVRYLFDNSGGTGRAQSPGWLDGSFVWTGAYRLQGEKLAFRETFTRKGQTLEDVFEVSQGGAWQVVATSTCARSR